MKNWQIGLLVAAVVFLIDQVAKYYVTGPLGLNVQDMSLTVLPIFDLRFIKNDGVSLGLLRATGPTTRWLLVLLTGAIAAGVFWWMLREKKRPDVAGLGLVLGGALGNILDRTRLGYVVDFADLHFGTWRPFLVFNVADAAITIGVLILLIRALFVRDKQAGTPAPVENEVNA
ncbi:signal peptidase II [Sphingomonas psychrotolerans]|uniref:Lipoprotein signal peptidase n=1 Tax=Sphingomonas psychrotolerans TaxID=1327635 RepID=A0A2K8MFT2_9SPHN|nr:signal peptidase II [Sphingomonas psychrotolerans]ATY32750.1 signal peptidase II [Sphingomonas psychrotolerans]